MVAFPVKLQLRHASFSAVALRDYPGDLPLIINGKKKIEIGSRDL